VLPIYSLALLHTSKPFAYTLHDVQSTITQNFLVAAGWLIKCTAVTEAAGGLFCESRYVRRNIIGSLVYRKADRGDNWLLRCSFEKMKTTIGYGQAEPDALPEKFCSTSAFWSTRNHCRLIEAFPEVWPKSPI